MFDITFTSISLLNELLVWMICQQLRPEARKAAEGLIEVLEDSEQEFPPCV